MSVTCAECRDWMLTADTHALSHAETDPDVPAEMRDHLAHCAGCQAAAREVLVSQTALGQELNARSAASSEVGIAAARRAIVAGRERQSHASRWSRRRWLAGLAVAASLAVAVVARDSATHRPPPAFSPLSPRVLAQAGLESPGEASPVVAAPPGLTVAVFHTSNPRITIVWYF